MEIVFDTSDPDAVYLATREHGYVYSYDNGRSWQHPADAVVHEGTVSSIAVDQVDKCTVYIAKGRNVIKTEDCNRTFDPELFVDATGETVTRVRTDWYDPQVVWIGTTGGSVVKSMNGGDTWTTVMRLGDGVVDLLVSRADSRVVVVATEDKGLFRTSDGGATWEDLEAALDPFRNAKNGILLREDVSGSVMYYANERGLLRSRDQGKSWEGVELLTPPSSVRIYGLAIHPDDGDRVYYGTSGTFYSATDGGKEWHTRELPTSRAATAIAVDPDETDLVFVGVTEIEE
jgi:photosystem II stability/assembly factor-like uncharacterized protein